MSRQFLTFATPEQASAADKAVQDVLRVTDKNLGSQWSGVSTNGKVFGILWASEVVDAGLKGTVVTEVISKDGVSNWTDYVPPQPDDQPL